MVEAVKRHALAHYEEDGWDTVVECWSEAEIADVVGIEKRLTHHVARRTFATTVLLFNNVPMEMFSELLGHSKMATTQQSYGKIVQRKVGDEMRRLNKEL